MNTFATRIKEARIALRISQTRLAELVGVDQSSIALWETGKTKPRQEKLVELAGVLYLTPEFLMFGDTGGDGAKEKIVPVVGFVGPGNEVHGVSDGVIQDTVAPPAADKDTPAPTKCVIVRGTSMWPVYRDGDQIFYNDNESLDAGDAIGRECVVKMKDGPIVVKRIMSGSKKGVYTLASYNAPELMNVRVDWCAPVTWVKRSQNHTD